MATIFGPAWRNLTLDAVRSYVADAEGEPLLWEAKGAGADAHHVRRTVCAFANSHDGGYLILGAEETATGLDFPGIALPDEPALWVANVVRDGVRPWPGIDATAFRTSCRGGLDPSAGDAAVHHAGHGVRADSRSQPSRQGPGSARRALPSRRCCQHGRDPARRERARLWLLGDYQHGLDDPEHAGFALAASATGYRDPDPSSVLFTDTFESTAHLAVGGLPSNEPEPLRQSPAFPEWSQDAIVWRRRSGFRHGSNWTMRVRWDGTVAISWSMAVEHVVPDSLVAGPVTGAWRTCLVMLSGLGAVSSHHLSLTLLGRQFADLSEVPFGKHPDRVPTLRRGPLDLNESADQLASVEREVRRVLGERAHEPESAKQDSAEGE